MINRGPERIIDLGDVAVDAGPSVAASPPRRAIRRAGVVLSAVLCAATLSASAVPQSHGPRLLWSMASDSQHQFLLTAQSVIMHPRHGHLAATDAADNLAAYDLVDGSLLWSTTVPDGAFLGGAWLADDALLVPSAGDLEPGDVRHDGVSRQSTVAVDVATGAQRWRVAGIVATTADGLGVVEEVGARTGRLTGVRAIRLTDGQTVWKRSVAGERDRVYGTDQLVAVAADGSAEVVRLADGGTVARGRVAWQAEAPGVHSSNALQISENAVIVSRYHGSGQVVTAYALDTLRRRWRIERPAGGSMTDCERVLCLSDPTATVAFDVATGAPRWRADGWTEPGPIGPGRLLVGNGETPTAYAVMDAETGHVLAELGHGTVTGRGLDRPYVLRHTRTPKDQLSLSRLDPRTGGTQLLGTVDPVYSDRCQASAIRLVCVGSDGMLAVTDVSSSSRPVT